MKYCQCAQTNPLVARCTRCDCNEHSLVFRCPTCDRRIGEEAWRARYAIVERQIAELRESRKRLLEERAVLEEHLGIRRVGAPAP